MLNHIPPRLVDRAKLPLAQRSCRPALTHLVLLAAADPTLAERLLHDESLEATVDHPHYLVQLDAHDRATLASLRAQARTISELLASLAEVADGPTT